MPTMYFRITTAVVCSYPAVAVYVSGRLLLVVFEGGLADDCLEDSHCVERGAVAVAVNIAGNDERVGNVAVGSGSFHTGGDVLRLGSGCAVCVCDLDELAVFDVVAEISNGVLLLEAGSDGALGRC